MSFAPRALYASNPHSITLILNTGDPEEEKLLRVLAKSFGDRYVRQVEIASPYHQALTLLPGGALEARQ